LENEGRGGFFFKYSDIALKNIEGVLKQIDVELNPLFSKGEIGKVKNLCPDKFLHASTIRFPGNEKVVSRTSFINKTKIGIKKFNVMISGIFSLLFHYSIVVFFKCITP